MSDEQNGKKDWPEDESDAEGVRRHVWSRKRAEATAWREGGCPGCHVWDECVIVGPSFWNVCHRHHVRHLFWEGGWWEVPEEAVAEYVQGTIEQDFRAWQRIGEYRRASNAEIWWPADSPRREEAEQRRQGVPSDPVATFLEGHIHRPSVVEEAEMILKHHETE